VPPIPAALADSVERYTHFRSAGFDSWHPARREMLIATRFADTVQIHHVAFPGGARSQLTFFPDSVAAARYQPTAGNYSCSQGPRWRREFSELPLRLRPGEVSLLTDGKSRPTRRLVTCGDRLAYGSTRRTGKDVDFTSSIHSSRKASPPDLNDGGGWSVLDWSPDAALCWRGRYLDQPELFVAGRHCHVARRPF